MYTEILAEKKQCDTLFFEFRKNNEDLVTKGSFNELNTDNEKVFAYSRSLAEESIIVIGNLDKKNEYKKISIKIPNYKKRTKIENITDSNAVKIRGNKLYIDLSAGEIIVLKYINKKKG